MCFLVAVEDFEFIGDFQFFQKPEDTLGAGLFKPVVVSRCFSMRCAIGCLPVKFDFWWFGCLN